MTGNNAPLYCPKGLANAVVSQPKLLALTLFLSGTVPLAMGYTAEYGFGLLPCILCLYQRIPFYLVAALGALGFFWRRPKLLRICLLLGVLLFVGNSGIAFFHVGVEHGWWQGTDECGGTGIAANLEALRAQIMGSPSVRCDEPAFVFLGLSMAGWNVVYCLLAAMVFVALEGMRTRHVNREDAAENGVKND